MLRFPPYSYLITDNKVDYDDKSVKKHRLSGNTSLYYTSDQEFDSHSIDDRSCFFVLGYCIDYGSETDSLKFILNQIAALVNDKSSLCDYLDRLVGRYIIGINDCKSNELTLHPDATCSLKVNYHEHGGHVSSNIYLLNSAINKGSAPDYRNEFTGENRSLWKFGSLGDLSPLNGIRILTPNQSLDVRTAKISRTFPRRNRTQLSVAEAREIVGDSARRQLRILTRKYSLFQSLTAGIDSRATLALSRTYKHDITYFTYCFKPDSSASTEVADVLFSSIIAKQLGLTHYQLYGTFEPKEAQRIPGRNVLTLTAGNMERYRQFESQFVWYPHISEAPAAYRKMVCAVDDDRPPLHIRSNIYEIGRNFWRPNDNTRDLLDSGNILANSRPDWNQNNISRSVFLDYFLRIGLRREEMCDYSILDFFYWEHRCGTWASEIIQASDYAFNTHNLLNSRELLASILSLSQSERSHSALFKELVRVEYPMLNKIPRNPSINFSSR